MYGGRVVEAGPVAEVFTRPRHRYTEGLLGASDLDVVAERGRLDTIAGSVPAGRASSRPGACSATAARTPRDLASSPRRGPAPRAAGFACHHPAGVTADGEVGSRG